MYLYKVMLGSRRYVTEKTQFVHADSTEEACNKAIRMYKNMRYAIARKEREQTCVNN